MTGIADDDLHCVNGDKTGNEARQQIERSDEFRDFAVREAQVQRQQIADCNREQDGKTRNPERVPHVRAGKLVCEQVDVVRECERARFAVHEAFDDRVDDRVDDDTHGDEKRWSEHPHYD